MANFSRYTSPIGELFLAEEGGVLTRLWFDGQRYTGDIPAGEDSDRETAVLTLAKRWLDRYFSGANPKTNVPFRLTGTSFQIAVWKILLTIPYGRTTSYGDIAGKMAASTGRRTSARAVGNAVARNTIAVMVPCHRVVSSNGRLTGYAAGIEKKAALLRLEGALCESREMPRTCP